jgi:hypothetical protein
LSIGTQITSCNCATHKSFTNHDENKYKEKARSLNIAINEIFPFIAITNKTTNLKIDESKKPAPYKTKPLRIGAFEVCNC